MMHWRGWGGVGMGIVSLVGCYFPAVTAEDGGGVFATIRCGLSIDLGAGYYPEATGATLTNTWAVRYAR